MTAVDSRSLPNSFGNRGIFHDNLEHTKSLTVSNKLSYSTLGKAMTPHMQDKASYDYYNSPLRTSTTVENANILVTAQIEELLNDIKVRAMQMVAEQNPGTQGLISNAVTETTYDVDPILGANTPTLALNAIVFQKDKNEHKRTANDTIDKHEARKCESPHKTLTQTLKGHAYTAAQDIEGFLQRELKLAYNKLKNKILIAKQNKNKTTENYITTQMIPDLTKHNFTKKKDKIEKQFRHNRGEKISKSTKITSEYQESGTAPTIDDLAMLTLYEQILAKTQEDNAMRILSMNKKRSQDNLFRLSKRNPETLTDLSLKDTIKKINDDGETIPDTDYSNDIQKSKLLDSTLATDSSQEDTSFQGLSDKISYKDYVNGFKNYLKFQKEEAKSNFSNVVKYQAHRHHKVDDIGKYILNKIPEVPKRKRSFFDDTDIDEQDISTKSEDSWFKKHFYMFIDKGSPKKYHTSETVAFKNVTEANRVEGKKGLDVNVTERSTRTNSMSKKQFALNINTHSLRHSKATSETVELKNAAEINAFDKMPLDYGATDLRIESTRDSRENDQINLDPLTYLLEGSKTKIKGHKIPTPRYYKADKTESYRDSGIHLNLNRYQRNCKNKVKTEKKANKLLKKSTVPSQQSEKRTDISKSSKNKKDGYVSLNTLPTAVVNLYKSKNAMGGKIKKLLNKLHYHRKNKKKLKGKRQCRRVERFDPIQKLKDMFMAKEETSTSTSYDIVPEHIHTQKAIEYINVQNVEDLRSAIPNISSDYEIKQSEESFDKLENKSEVKDNVNKVLDKMLSEIDYLDEALKINPSVDGTFINNQKVLSYNSQKTTTSHIVTNSTSKTNSFDEFSINSGDENSKIEKINEYILVNTQNSQITENSRKYMFQTTPRDIKTFLKSNVDVSTETEIYPMSTSWRADTKTKNVTVYPKYFEIVVDDPENKNTRDNTKINFRSDYPNIFQIFESNQSNTNHITPESDITPNYINIYSERNPPFLQAVQSNLDSNSENKNTDPPFLECVQKNPNDLELFFYKQESEKINPYKQHASDREEKQINNPKKSIAQKHTNKLPNRDHPITKSNSDYLNGANNGDHGILNGNKGPSSEHEISDVIQPFKQATPSSSRVIMNSELLNLREHFNSKMDLIDSLLEQQYNFLPTPKPYVAVAEKLKLSFIEPKTENKDKVPSDKPREPNIYTAVSQDIIDVLNKMYTSPPNGVKIWRAIGKWKISNELKPDEKYISINKAPIKDATLSYHDTNSEPTMNLSIRSTKRKHKEIHPTAKLNKQPVQYYSTPLPMKNVQFDRFLKENQLDVESVTAPLTPMPTLTDAWNSKLMPRFTDNTHTDQNKAAKDVNNERNYITTKDTSIIDKLAIKSYPESQIDYLNDLEEDLLNDTPYERHKRGYDPLYNTSDDKGNGDKMTVDNPTERNNYLGSNVDITIINFDDTDIQSNGNEEPIKQSLTLINNTTVKDVVTPNLSNIMVDREAKEYKDSNNSEIHDIITIIDVVDAVDDFTKPDVPIHIDLPTYYAPNPDITIKFIPIVKTSWADIVLKYISGIALIEILNKLGGVNFTEDLAFNFNHYKVFSSDGAVESGDRRSARDAKTTNMPRSQTSRNNKQSNNLITNIKQKLFNRNNKLTRNTQNIDLGKHMSKTIKLEREKNLIETDNMKQKKQTNKPDYKITPVYNDRITSPNLENYFIKREHKSKREVNNVTYTAKNVAALEIIVDMKQNLADRDKAALDNLYTTSLYLKTNDNNMEHINDNLGRNSLQVYIALPYDRLSRKRSLDLPKARRVFVAQMEKPIDLQYQIYSVDDNFEATTVANTMATKTTKRDIGVSQGIYMLVDYMNGTLALKPVQPGPTVKCNESHNKEKQRKKIKRDKASLNEEYIAAINRYLLQLYNNLTAIDSKSKIHNVEKRNTWDKIKQSFSDERVCTCKCRENKTMCRTCAATDAVVRELTFEFDNLEKYIRDHCTELQTFFRMNPKDGKVLRDSVRKIENSLNSYYKRIRSKCKGQKCRTFTTIDKRDANNTNNYKRDIRIDGRESLLCNGSLSSRFNPSFENLTLKSNEVVDIAFKDFSKPILKRSNKASNALLLDHISVNIICNTNATTEPAITNAISLLEETNIDNGVNNFIDYDNRNNIEETYLQKLLTTIKQLKSDKLFWYYINDTNYNSMKREAKYDQIEAPLNADTGGSFWHDYLNKGNRDVSNHLIPDVKISVVQTNAENYGDVLKNANRETTSTKTEDSAKETDDIVGKNAPFLLQADTLTNEDSLTHHMANLYKLIGTIKDVEEIQYSSSESTINKASTTHKTKKTNKRKIHKLKKPKKKQYSITTKLVTHKSLIDDMTLDSSPSHILLPTTLIVPSKRSNKNTITAKNGKAKIIVGVTSVTSKTLSDSLDDLLKSITMTEAAQNNDGPTGASTSKKSLTSMGEESTVATHTTIHFFDKIKWATLSFLKNKIKDLAKNKDIVKTTTNKAIKDPKISDKTSGKNNTESKTTTNVNPATTKDHKDALPKNKNNKYKSLLLSLINHETDILNKEKQSIENGDILEEEGFHDTDFVEMFSPKTNQGIAPKPKPKSITEQIKKMNTRNLKNAGTTSLIAKPGKMERILRKWRLKNVPQTKMATSKVLEPAKEIKKDHRKTKTLIKRRESRSTNEEADPPKTSFENENKHVRQKRRNYSQKTQDIQSSERNKHDKDSKRRKDDYRDIEELKRHRKSNYENIDNNADEIASYNEKYRSRNTKNPSDKNRAWVNRNIYHRAQFDSYVKGEYGIYRLKRNGYYEDGRQNNFKRENDIYANNDNIEQLKNKIFFKSKKLKRGILEYAQNNNISSSGTNMKNNDTRDTFAKKGNNDSNQIETANSLTKTGIENNNKNEINTKFSKKSRDERSVGVSERTHRATAAGLLTTMACVYVVLAVFAAFINWFYRIV